MENQKLENILNLALTVSEEERMRSRQLQVGFFEEDKTWELIVKYNGDISRFANDLIEIEELIAGYAIVRIPENLVEAFSALEEIEFVEKPKRLYFATLQGREASCLFGLTAREPFLTGKGVLIGIIDSGIDLQSPEFRDDSGGSRVLYLWDQQLEKEFTKEQIDTLLFAERQEAILPGFDVTGHGTAVAAIAAAGGRLVDGRYRGVAPESKLLVVKLGSAEQDSFPRTTQLMRALTYMVKKAVELGMPLSINLSFGNTYGSHDGTSLVERFLDNAAEIGRTVICAGSGNEGAAGGHVAGTVSNAGDRRRVELSVGAYQASFSVQLWKEYTDRFLVTIVSPAGERQTVDTRQAGTQVLQMEQTQLLLYIGEPAPYSVNQELYFDFLPEIGAAYVNAGIWSFELVAVDTVLGNYDFYLPSNTVLNEETRFFTPTPVKTLTIPSTASKIITVGAYDAVYDAYADFSGRGYAFQSTAGERSFQGSIKPDIAAPGVNIQTIGPDGTYVQVSGTSFATPFVTGSAALLLEWGIVRGNDPFLYGEKVKAYFRRGARPIRGESIYPNDRVGYGALCVENSLPK